MVRSTRQPLSVPRCCPNVVVDRTEEKHEMIWSLNTREVMRYTSHNGVPEHSSVLECDALTVCQRLPTFRKHCDPSDQSTERHGVTSRKIWVYVSCSRIERQSVYPCTKQLCLYVRNNNFHPRALASRNPLRSVLYSNHFSRQTIQSAGRCAQG